MKKKPNRAQQESLLRKYQQNPSGFDSYLSFRRSSFFCFNTLMINWCGMLIGIEPDGYTHS